MGISPKQFAELQQRVSAPRSSRRAASAGVEPLAPAMAAAAHSIVIGIDPSLRGTGWGIVRVGRGVDPLSALGFGTIHCPATWPRTRCLVKIAAELRCAIATHQPTTCAIEGLFFAQNLQTALLMGEARGVCLLAAAEAGVEICEIAPRKVKQAIVGFGGAQKTAVARMVQRLLALSEPPPADAADALALALVHAREVVRPTLAPRQRL